MTTLIEAIEDRPVVVMGDLGPCEILIVGTNTFLLEEPCGVADDFTVTRKQNKKRLGIKCLVGLFYSENTDQLRTRSLPRS